MYRAKPIVVKALQVRGGMLNAIDHFVSGRSQPARMAGPGRGIAEGVEIRTVDQHVRVRHGSWLLRYPGRKGFRVCSDAEFQEHYEPMNKESTT